MKVFRLVRRRDVKSEVVELERFERDLLRLIEMYREEGLDYAVRYAMGVLKSVRFSLLVKKSLEE